MKPQEKDMIVYISGAISNDNEVIEQENIQFFASEKSRLSSRFAAIHDPASFTEKDWTWEQYLARDLAWIAIHKPILYMLKGWKTSKGATLERYFAEGLGLTVIDETGE